MDVIDGWIRDCETNHPLCHRSTSIGRKQTFLRILDTSVSRDSSRVRLCESREIPESAHYLTLSHCWGGAEIKSLSSATYDNYKNGVQVEELPRTFQDAVNLTRRLAIRYLWIDAVCIMQDSTSDWVYHASTMDAIYRYAYCNIAATVAENPYGGLFREREPALISPLRVKISDSSFNGGSAFYDVGDDFSEAWTRQIIKSPLASRAWVVQERLLARRVVHFARSQLFWECAEIRTSEVSTLSLLDQSGQVPEIVNFKTWDPASRNVSNEPSHGAMSLNYVWSAFKAMYGREEGFNKSRLANSAELVIQARVLCFGDDRLTHTHPLIGYWAEILRTYSIGKLTYASDRLVALSGLARALQGEVNMQYAAGLWLEQLPRQLLWNVRDRTPIENSGKYIAPTWSWASMSIGAVWNLKPYRILELNGAMDLIKVVKTDIRGTNGVENSLGELATASIRIRGRLMPISLEHSAWRTGSTRKDHLVQYWIPSTREKPAHETFLVPVLFTRWNERLPADTTNSLLLEATSTKGTFRRIGTAYLSSLCPLQYNVPHLAQAKSRDFEDEDDDATSEGEADHEEKAEEGNSSVPVNQTALGLQTGQPGTSSVATVPNARQQHAQNRMAMLGSPKVKQILTQLQARASKKALPPEKAASVFSFLQSAVDNQPGTPSKQGIIITEEMKADMAKETSQTMGGGDVKVITRRNPRSVKSYEYEKIKFPSPRETVAPQFRLECLDDEDTVRYGHFVFEII